MTEFRLLETMRGTQDGNVFLLHRHLARLSGSAKHLSFSCDLENLRSSVLKAVEQNQKPSCIRVMLSRNGEFDIEFQPLPSTNPSRIRLSKVRVDSSNPFLYHKTTNRGVYEESRRGCDSETEVILFNEKGEITEATIANIAVFREGQWVTPAVSCGLLPGVMRAELLSRGEIVEGVIRADELVPGETVRCFNALRGMFETK